MNVNEEWTPEQHNAAIRRKIEKIKMRVPFEISDMNEIASLQDDLLDTTTDHGAPVPPPAAMTESELAAIDARLAKLKNVSWRSGGEQSDGWRSWFRVCTVSKLEHEPDERVADVSFEEDADFIFHAPDDVRRLVAEIRRLRTLVREL